MLTVLAATVGQVMAEQIRERALDYASRAAQVVGALGVRAAIPEQELSGGVSAETLERTDREIVGVLRRAGVLKLKVFDRDRVMVYSNDRRGIGRAAPAKSNLAVALAGGSVSRLGRGTDDDGQGVETLEMYQPLRYRESGRPAGAYEVYVDYSATSAAIARDQRRLWILLSGGLFVVWALLFRLVRGALAALRRQVADNRHLARHDALTGLPNVPSSTRSSDARSTNTAGSRSTPLCCSSTSAASRTSTTRIETARACERVGDLGCHEGRGFLFARPMWSADVPEWVAARPLVRAA